MGGLGDRGPGGDLGGAKQCGNSCAADWRSTRDVQHPGLLASAADGSDISTSISGRWRYMAIAGPTKTSSNRLAIAITHFLIKRGWRDPTASVVRYSANPIKAVPITTPGATVLINSPNRKFYAALSPIESQYDAEQQTAGSPLWGKPSIRNAIKRHEPVVSITLGNGTHG